MMEKRQRAFHRLIRRRRWELGLTQSKLAERIGVTTDAVVKWESGRRRPRAIQIARIAAALEIPAGRLFDEYERE